MISDVAMQPGVESGRRWWGVHVDQVVADCDVLKAGQWRDSVVHAILDREWQSTKGGRAE